MKKYFFAAIAVIVIAGLFGFSMLLVFSVLFIGIPVMIGLIALGEKLHLGESDCKTKAGEAA